MKSLKFRLEPVDESVFDTARSKISDTFRIQKPAQAVWDELTAEGTLHWCRILDAVNWTSPRPFGVGTTRYVKALKGANQINEYFFRWEDGRRKSFYVAESSGPLFKRFAEDYVVEPDGDNACRFTWTIAFDGRPGTAPVNKMIMRTLFTDTRKYYGSP